MRTIKEVIHLAGGVNHLQRIHDGFNFDLDLYVTVDMNKVVHSLSPGLLIDEIVYKRKVYAHDGWDFIVYVDDNVTEQQVLEVLYASY